MTEAILRTSPTTICLFTGTLAAFAGAERATATLANALAARGHRVHVLSLWGETPVFPLAPGVMHHALFPERVPFKYRYASIVCRVRRYLRTHDVAVLIDVDPMLALYTVPATLGMRLHRIAWEHSTYASDLGRRARRWARALAARRCQAIVVLTDDDARAWQQHHPHARARLVTLANPLGLSGPEAPRTSSTPDNKRVLAVGRLIAEKGFDLLIDAWAQIAPHAPGWQVQIVGDGALQPTLTAQIHAAGLAQSVTLVPATADIGKHYAAASIYCLPSRQESFGLVLIEAQAFGLPIAAYAADAGPRALLHDGVDSLIAATGDVASLATCLRRLIDDADLRARLGAAGFAHAQQFRPDVIAARWESLWTTPEVAA